MTQQKINVDEIAILIQTEQDKQNVIDFFRPHFEPFDSAYETWEINIGDYCYVSRYGNMYATQEVPTNEYGKQFTVVKGIPTL